MIDLYIYKRNADNEMLTMIELYIYTMIEYIYKRNAHNDWSVHL